MAAEVDNDQGSIPTELSRFGDVRVCYFCCPFLSGEAVPVSVRTPQFGGGVLQ